MGMRIVRGRSFSEPGRAPYPELVVNQEFVRRYFAGTNPVGQLVGDQPRYQVVGVVLGSSMTIDGRPSRTSLVAVSP